MKQLNCKKGFTLIELMIVIVVVAILVAMAMPSYTQFIRKAKRGEAQQLMLNMANRQEIWRANNPSYDDGGNIGIPTSDYYVFTVTISAATASAAYLLTADATGDQENDKDKGESCDVMTLDQSGAKGPKYDDGNGNDVTYCWGD